LKYTALNIAAWRSGQSRQSHYLKNACSNHAAATNLNLILFMATIEQQAYDILSEEKYKITIAGQEISFRYATLDDLEKISAISSKLPLFDEIDKSEDKDADVPQIVDAFKYAKDLGKIIIVSAEYRSECRIRLIRPVISYFHKRKLLKTIYKKAKILDIWAAVQQIMKNNHVFFYQNTITFLKGMNQLKATKETEATVHG